MTSKCSRLALCLALCLCLAAACAAAADGASGRGLLQSAANPNATDCARSVKNCKTCRYQFYRGTVTKAVCLSCETGYQVKASGRACWCAPGYYLDADGTTCNPCGNNNWCPGAKSTASSADKKACGLHKVTTTQLAKSDRECVASPGFGWATGDASAACPLGYYNPGYNTRKCSPCPGSLTTNSNQSVRIQDCIAPQGYYYLGGHAVPCAEGFYKELNGNDDCTPCPDGWTTPLGTTGTIPRTDCNVLRPGYSTSAAVPDGNTPATKCLPNTYRVDYITVTTATAVPCQDCPSGMQTLLNVTGATSNDSCLAPPGYGYDPAAVTATICGVGYYNDGWNREPCKLCGTGGITTEAQGSTSPADCYVPAGYGTTRSNNGTWLDAYLCPPNTYGLPNNTYGLLDVACTKCMEHMSTNTTGSSSDTACVTDPGYGYYSGQVLLCDYGYYSGGNTKNPCSFCGEGYNTTQYQNDEAGLKNATQGADEASDCVIDFGWTQANPDDSSKGIKPCPQGSYKDYLGNGSCLLCPNGTSSSVLLAATALSDCDVCRPGFGTPYNSTYNESIPLGNPVCTRCISGTFSFGMVRGGQRCTDCPRPNGFTGTMVSRDGSTDPQDCVPEFPTDPNRMDNGLAYDIIPLPSGALTTIGANNTEADCQRACHYDPTCMYFEFYNYTSLNKRCYHYRSANPISKIDVFTTASPYVAFGVGPGLYVAYRANTQALADGTGIDIPGVTVTSLPDAEAECDTRDECAGFSHSPAGFRLFKGAKVENAVGKVRAYGNAINSWTAQPDYDAGGSGGGGGPGPAVGAVFSTGGHNLRYEGCRTAWTNFTDHSTFALPYFSVKGPTNSRDVCCSFAASQFATYCGLVGRYCTFGSAAPSAAFDVSEGACDLPCAGDPTQICGSATTIAAPAASLYAIIS